MKRPFIITGLDIGSSKISAAAAEIDAAGIFRILAVENAASKGMSKGAIVDMHDASDAVAKALERLKVKISRHPEHIYCNVSGESVKLEKSKGMIPLSLRGREVTKVDMARCTNVASTIQLPFDREILHRIVNRFSVDDQPWIKNPRGLYASRLACEVHVITANTNQIQNLYKCVNNAGYDIEEVLYTGVAEGVALLQEFEKEEGVALLDVGAFLTEVSIFHGGVLSFLDVAQIGTEDIGQDLKGSPKLSELTSSLRSSIDQFIDKGGRVNSVILTGGFSFADGAIEILEERLSRPVRMGVAKDLRGDVSSLESVKAVTSIGLARYAFEKMKKIQEEKNSLPRNLTNKLIEMFNNYF